MNWIQNDNQNVDGVDLFIGDILFHKVTQFWCFLCLMIVLDYMWKHLLFRFLLHLCFFIHSVNKMCTIL